MSVNDMIKQQSNYHSTSLKIEVMKSDHKYDHRYDNVDYYCLDKYVW